MADGKTHAKYAGRAAIGITVLSCTASVFIHPVCSGLIVGAWGAYLAGPDMDHHNHTEDEARVYRFNAVLGFLWSWYWGFYQRRNKHRGRSHTIPDGTLDRYWLLFWPVQVYSVRFIPEYGVWVIVFWALALVGQMLVDIVHLWLDGLI